MTQGRSIGPKPTGPRILYGGEGYAAVTQPLGHTGL